jgi:hypothetical protein
MVRAGCCVQQARPLASRRPSRKTNESSRAMTGHQASNLSRPSLTLEVSLEKAWHTQDAPRNELNDVKPRQSDCLHAGLAFCFPKYVCTSGITAGSALAGSNECLLHTALRYITQATRAVTGLSSPVASHTSLHNAQSCLTECILKRVILFLSIATKGLCPCLVSNISACSFTVQYPYQQSSCKRALLPLHSFLRTPCCFSDTFWYHELRSW